MPPQRFAAEQKVPYQHSKHHAGAPPSEDLADANLGLQIALLRVGRVAEHLAADPKAATRMIGIRAPILHLAFSQHWRHVPAGAEASVALAEMLVANGADVNAGYPAGPTVQNLLLKLLCSRLIF